MDTTNIREQFARNRGKSLLLAVLMVVMVGLVVRVVVNAQPRSAAASLAVGNQGGSGASVVIDATAQKELVERVRQSQTLWKVLRERRGIAVGQLFSFEASYYTLDPNRRVSVEARPHQQTTMVPQVQRVEPDLGPRLSLEEQVGRMQLQSTIMNADPVAVINARLLRGGDVIEGFRVVAIQAREVTLEKDGKKVVLRMSR